MFFADFKKAFDTINRQALEWKLRRKGVSNKFVNGIRNINQGIRLCGRSERLGVTDEIDQKLGLRQGCKLSPILFNIFIDDILEKIQQSNTHCPVIGGKEIPGPLYADDLIVGAITGVGLQRAINEVDRFCEEWGMKINIGKSKIMVFKKRK